jgi:hypothetical protein
LGNTTEGRCPNLGEAIVRLRFLYDDLEHATPLLRAQDVLAGQGIDVIAEETHSVESVVRLVEPGNDVLIIHQTLMSDDALDCGKPIIILERIDGAQLAASRRWLSAENVKAAMKGYAYRRPDLNNMYRGRYHAHLLKEAGLTAAPGAHSSAVDGMPSPQLSTAELEKIRTGYGFGAYAKMDMPRGQMVDFSASREYDLHCVGYVDYKGSEIEAHRLAAMAVAEGMEAASRESHMAANTGTVIVGRGRVLRPAEYYATMFRSRVVASPWGWGEACHRDYEAWLLGAVLVKPPMDHVKCWPDIYRPNETYIPCRLDFADLPDIVARVTAEWPDWRKRREAARELALEAGDPKRVARRIAGLLEKVL